MKDTRDCLYCADDSRAFPTLQSLHFPSDSIRSLLYSNAEPCQVEFQQIAATLEQATREFDVLSSRVALLHKWLDSEHARHEQAVRRYQIVLSVMRRVPDDVLRLIFSAAANGVDDCNRLNTEMGVWPLSKVCSRWREVALSAPSLWSTIGIGGVAQEDSMLSIQLDALSTSLTRSNRGETPLNIIFNNEGHDTASWMRALKMIVSHASRWESLCVDLKPEVQECLVAIESAPLLRRVDLCYRPPGLKPRLELGFLRHAPKLQHVKVLPYTKLHFPWNQLISFHCKKPFPILKPRFVDILRQFSSLRHLVIDLDAQLANSKVTLPRLQTLSLTWYSMMEGLQYLTLPALSNLVLDAPFPVTSSWGGQGWPSLSNAIVDVATILESSFSPLAEFTLKLRHRRGQVLDLEQIRRLLRAASSLETFRFFVTMEFDDKHTLFSLLTCHPNAEILVPQLQSLMVGVCHAEEDEESEESDSDSNTLPEHLELERLLNEMIESRKAHGQASFTAKDDACECYYDCLPSESVAVYE